MRQVDAILLGTDPRHLLEVQGHEPSLPGLHRQQDPGMHDPALPGAAGLLFQSMPFTHLRDTLLTGRMSATTWEGLDREDWPCIENVLGEVHSRPMVLSFIRLTDRPVYFGEDEICIAVNRHKLEVGNPRNRISEVESGDDWLRRNVHRAVFLTNPESWLVDSYNRAESSWSQQAADHEDEERHSAWDEHRCEHFASEFVPRLKRIGRTPFPLLMTENSEEKLDFDVGWLYAVVCRDEGVAEEVREELRDCDEDVSGVKVAVEAGITAPNYGMQP